MKSTTKKILGTKLTACVKFVDEIDRKKIGDEINTKYKV